jgi:hypothetical protein
LVVGIDFPRLLEPAAWYLFEVVATDVLSSKNRYFAMISGDLPASSNKMHFILSFKKGAHCGQSPKLLLQ